MTSSAVHPRHIMPALFLIAFALQGAKRPLAFSIWGTLAVLACLLIFVKGDPAHRRGRRGIAGLVALGATLILGATARSVDPAGSLLWASEALVYGLIAWTLLSHPDALGASDTWRVVWRIAAVATVAVTGVQSVRGLEAFGWLPLNRNFNAFFMIVAAIALIRAEPAPSRWRKLDAGLAIALLILTLPGGSRSGWLGMAAALPFLAPVRLPKGIRIATAAIALFAIGITLAGRSREPEFLRLDRTRFWSVALRAIGDKPWFGWGPGQFEVPYLKRPIPVDSDPVRYGRVTMFAHNEYLQAASDAGIPFLIVMLALLTHAFWVSRRTSEGDVATAKATLAASAAVAVVNPLWHLPILSFVTVAAWARLEQEASDTPSVDKRNGVPCLAVAALLPVIVWVAVRDRWIESGQAEKVVRVAPWDAPAWHAAASQSGSAQASLPLHERAVALAPLVPYYREGLAEALWAAGNPADRKRAGEEFERVQHDAPFRATNAFALGVIRFEEGRLQDARAWFEVAKAAEPRFWTNNVFLAHTLSLQGERDAGARLLHETLTQYRAFRQDAAAMAHPTARSAYGRRILADPQPVQERLLPKASSR